MASFCFAAAIISVGGNKRLTASAIKELSGNRFALQQQVLAAASFPPRSSQYAMSGDGHLDSSDASTCMQPVGY
jgi:hypothetical protein